MSHSFEMMLSRLDLVVVWWCLVAAVVAFVRPLEAAPRRHVLGGASVLGLTALATTWLPATAAGDVVRTLLPALFVLGAYWTAAGYVVAPDTRLEARLLAIDHWALDALRLPHRLTTGPRWVLEGLEAAYLSVYAMLPLGAWAAWVHGRAAAVDRYWTVVFLAEASCYLALAWLPTRPPRDLEPWAAALRTRSLFRHANETVLTHGSHRMNTIPSGHAAGAVAVAVSLAWLHVPLAPVFAVAALAICVATVVGRYHFLVDTLAGALVALAWWWVVSASL
jgi:membrane-associated phospholipid phosphatase